MELNKIYNEDCLEGMKRIPDKSVDMILCDLPYEVTALKWDKIIPLDKIWEQYERIIKDNGAIVLTATQPFTSKLVMSNPKLFKYEWIWEKQKASNFMSVKHQPLKYHENILVFSKEKVNYNPQKYKVLEIEEIMKMNKKELMSLMKFKDYDRFGKVDRRKTINDSVVAKDDIVMKKGSINKRYKDSEYRYPKSVLKINKEINGLIHPTQKPVALFEYLIKTYTNEGETVLDNCMGSGTTAIACINTNRNYIGFELDKEYYELSNNRIKEFISEKELTNK